MIDWNFKCTWILIPWLSLLASLVTIWGCDSSTHRSSSISARRMSNAKGSKSAKLCDIHFAMQDGSRRVVWIRSLPPSPFVLVLVVHSVSQSIRERKLVSYLCERLLTASTIYNQERTWWHLLSCTLSNNKLFAGFIVVLSLRIITRKEDKKGDSKPQSLDWLYCRERISCWFP